jgi:hypothetical protein
MPSTSPDRRTRSPGTGALLLVAFLLAVPAAPASAAKDRTGLLCEVANAVSAEGQLRERTRKCKKDDVLVVLVQSASLPATRAAALACDFGARILIEDTTEAPGIARVTCNFAGEVRTKR